MDIQDTKEQRQAFEAWCIQWNIASVFPLDDEGQYSDYNIHLLYCAWLQGQAAKAQAIPDGFVLVPVDTLEECLEWAHIAKWDSSSNAENEKITHHGVIIESAISAQEQSHD